MRWFWGFAVWLAVAVLGVEAGEPRIPTVQLNGRAYFEIGQWAALRGFSTRWNTKAGELTISNRWAKMFFKADTRRCDFDDVTVALSYPVLRTGDHLYMALFDEQTVVHRLLHPPRLASGRRVATVAVNAGHGGKDPGNLDSMREEKKYTLLLARELEKVLKRNGLKVVYIRDADYFVPLDERASLARKLGADIYVSLHFNSSPAGDGPEGLETYCLTPAGAASTNDRSGFTGRSGPGNRFDEFSLQLAYQIHRAALYGTELSDRGVRHARFKELLVAEMPAVLVEGGYMSNREDARRIFSESGRVRYAQALGDGIMAYKRLVERGQPE
jgi:N-acetylmuramoyl-L-alanine amidase